jgi:hypothetical protein
VKQRPLATAQIVEIDLQAGEQEQRRDAQPREQRQRVVMAERAKEHGRAHAEAEARQWRRDSKPLQGARDHHQSEDQRQIGNFVGDG